MTDTAEASASSRSLWQAFARGVRDNALAESAVQTLRVGGRILLARRLTPADFGTFKAAFIISGFGMLLNEAGLADALVQRKELTPRHEATVWWLTLGFALIISSGLYVLAPALASVMAMPELTHGVRLLCPCMLFAGTTITANARLRRQLRFSILALADALSELCFLLAALLLLVCGLPRISLMVGLGVRLASNAFALWMTAPYLPTTRPSLSAGRDLAQFSLSACAGQLVTVASWNADFILIGALLGSKALGFYMIAWELLRFIPDRLYKVVIRTAMPAFCRLQDDNRELARGYCTLISYMGRLVLPAVVCAAIAAPEVIGTLYGPQWLKTAVLLRWLAPGLALVGMRSGIGAIYYSKGRPGLDIYLNGARLCMILVTVTALAPHGLIAVSAGMSAVEGSIGILGQAMVCLLITLSPSALLVAAWPGLKLAILCGLATVAAKIAVAAINLNGVLQIALIVAAPAVVFCAYEMRALRALLQTFFPTASYGSAGAQ
jgi:O-antigen/teichoic acid export membrane protein